ncbi:hypothetical protein I6E29_05295 [Arcanobacterium haemolyticum]|nr:hypothetical protein [Arcanobacterium haemolyticum]
MKALLRLELTTVRHTWLSWVPALTFVALAILSLLTARYSQELLRAILGDSTAGLIPEPSWEQSYLQWVKNLSQIGIFVVILTGAGATSSLISDGQAALLATRPVPRWAQPFAAFVARALPIIASFALATGALYAGTRLFFTDAPLSPLLYASTAWALCALLFLATATGFSAILGSTLGAAGATITLYLALSILSTFEKTATWSPAGLLAAPSHLAQAGHTSLLIPALTGATLSFGLLLCGMWNFARREL